MEKKLIRDKIPQLLEAKKANYQVAILNDVEYKIALEIKLTEEISEFLAARAGAEKIEELADVCEVIEALMKVEGISFDEVLQQKKAKKTARGGFEGKFFLEFLEKKV